MIKANHHIVYERFFDFYLGWIMRRDFHSHRIVELPAYGGEYIPEQGGLPQLSEALCDSIRGSAVLMIGNHFSWWDGFFARVVNRKVLKKRLHVMMLEEQLRPRLFLTRLGAYSIRQNHRSAMESINYSVGLLYDPGNLVVLFPQGRFQSQYTYPVSFENGWFRILQKAPENINLVFMANLTDYFDHRKPVLTTYLRLMEKNSFSDANSVEQAYNDFLRGSNLAQQPQ